MQQTKSQIHDHDVLFATSSKMGPDYQETEEAARKGKKDYYNSGSVELATDTPLTLNRLETVSFDSFHTFS